MLEFKQILLAKFDSNLVESSPDIAQEEITDPRRIEDAFRGEGDTDHHQD